MPRTATYLNAASNGPVGIEYFLPTAESIFADHLQFLHQDAAAVLSKLKDAWCTQDDVAGKIADTLLRFVPRSLYYLPTGGECDRWLLAELGKHVLFIPPRRSFDCKTAPAELQQLISLFGGFQFGHNHHVDDNFLRPDSGFANPAAIRPIHETDESFTWESDSSVLGGVHFFTTDTGDRLYCRIDNSIARWQMGNAEIEDLFPDCLSFAQEFARHYGDGCDDSPLA